MQRLKAYEEAGADVLYAPGLPDETALRTVCDALENPFNYVAGVSANGYAVDQLKDFGVRRVTIGTSFARASLAALVRAAREVLEDGTFGYVDGVPSVTDFNEFIDPHDNVS